MQINRCPKCGRKPVSIEMYTPEFFLVWYIKCLRCKLHTGLCKTKDEAVAKWNENAKKETK